MESRLSTRREGVALGANLPRVSGIAEDNDNEDEKIYYGFGVFMGLPLAELKAIKEKFVEQQALTGEPPQRTLPHPAVTDGLTHHIEDDEGVRENQDSLRMVPTHTQQQQPQHPSHVNGYETPRSDSQSREYGNERDRYSQGQLNVERDEGGDNSDTSDEFGQKSHSLNFILH
ncbi:uncharacterized protein PHALS_05282 [Plasmopara halstedii]|uniref:Uncharacterized protein n=1 Tax=Plasmopara halstedii TaxID=4781 RepID=A0A0P1A9L2_PLAHL|nr:uncharacterized protein PHALS_05282 [Plasmopara halstedii]CEG37501.1 hypothetical protein PHALS_05282 [Plasmopara halstedii]|eukprot:XP_024573870.1 hypothetical protein PHALS_05282 [Plasmopara halstedii]